MRENTINENHHPNSILRTARVSLGMKSKEAAAAIGVTKHTYLMWERGDMAPMPDKTQKIAQVLCLPVESVPVSGKHKPYSKRPMKVYDPRKAALIEEYTPYRDRRLELGLTQVELAERAGVRCTTISSMECGINDPIWQTRQKIRRALGWPEERHFTVEERNELILSMGKFFHWVLNQHREYLRTAHVDLEDAYQDLVLCAIKAIDRFDPAGGAKMENYLICQLKQEVKNIRRRTIAKGLVGKGTNHLPYNTTVSFDDFTQHGYEIGLEAAA